MLLKLKAQSEKCKTDTKCHPEEAKRLKDLISEACELTLFRFFASLRMTVVLSLFALTLTLYASPVYAASPTPCDPTIPGDCPAGLQQLEDIFSNIISIVVGLGFVATLVLLVWSGFKFILSGGEPKGLQIARHTAVWALLGILFMAIAWLILQLIANFTGLQVTIFDIRTLCGVGGIEFCK